MMTTDRRSKVMFLFTTASLDVKLSSFSTSCFTSAETQRERQYQCFMDLLSPTFFNTPAHKDTHSHAHTTHCVSSFDILPCPVKPSHTSLFSQLLSSEAVRPVALPCSFFSISLLPLLLSFPCLVILSLSSVRSLPLYSCVLLQRRGRLSYRGSRLPSEHKGIFKSCFVMRCKHKCCTAHTFSLTVTLVRVCISNVNFECVDTKILKCNVNTVHKHKNCS